MRKHKRSLLLALLLCCVSVIAMTGIYRRETRQNEELNDLVELSEADEDQVPSKEEVSALVEASLDAEDFLGEGSDAFGTDRTGDDREETDQSVFEGQPVPILSGDGTDQSENNDADEQESAVETIAGVAKLGVLPEDVLNFQEDSVLTWPVQGDVLMEYSMDKTVYFATLEQYKYNPGMLIRGEEGMMVYAGADAIVTEISQSDELGCTVTMDLGNSYTVKYGQLKALNVEEGDMVTSGTAIGLVAAPTKYYSVEGDHVYMELQKDGQPIDALDYLD